MNRREEYDLLLQELETTPPALEYTLPRAKARLRRRRCLFRPAASLASFFVCFVLLVNFCTPVAYACSRVPFLRELAAAVTFSPSLTAAVEHEYVQPLELEQTQNGITARVEYLIVDEKQVNIFYRISGDDYDLFNEHPIIRQLNGEHMRSCSYGLNDWDAPAGALKSMTVDFVEADVPPALRLELDVRGTREEERWQTAPEHATDLLPSEWDTTEPDPHATFTFDIHFDPAFTAPGKLIPVGQVIQLEGQAITVENIEIYPTHLRMNLLEDEANTARLEGLEFSILINGGKRFGPISDGIVSTATQEDPRRLSYRTDSPYFEDARTITVSITKAEFTEKDRERCHLNLLTGEMDFIPEGVTFHSARQLRGTWEVEFLVEETKEHHFFSVWEHNYYDPEGGEHDITSATHGSHSVEKEDGSFEQLEGVFLNAIYLEDYPYDEVWLTPAYTRRWRAETPLTFTVEVPEDAAS